MIDAPNAIIAADYLIIGIGVLTRPWAWGLSSPRWVALLALFGGFILSCGVGHAGLMMTNWDWVTAGVSTATAAFVAIQDGQFRSFFDGDRLAFAVLASKNLEPLHVLEYSPLRDDFRMIQGSPAGMRESKLKMGEWLCEVLPAHRLHQHPNPAPLINIYKDVAEYGETFKGTVIYEDKIAGVEGAFEVTIEQISRGRILIRWRNVSEAMAYLRGMSGVLEAVTAFNKGEMFLAYQPIYALAGLDLDNMPEPASYEGLIRWRKDGELRSPAQFLPALDSQGLQAQVFYFTVRKALTLLRDRPDVPKVSINLDPVVIATGEFPQRFLEICSRFKNVLPERIGIELTERALEEIPIVPSLEGLKSTGSIVGIDDFGSGSANLRNLAELVQVVGYIKLDSRLVSGCHKDQSKQRVLESLIELFHKLELPVVAEGIELDAELQVLKDLGCDYGQGYLLGKPTAL